MINHIPTLFQSFRTILCICPSCGAMQRLSDLHLEYNGQSPKTWLDSYDKKIRTMEGKELEFELIEQSLRDSATERGRKRVPRIIRNSLSSVFTKLRYNPYDIKALLHPVDFVVFDGLNNNNNLKEIVFLSKEARDTQLKILRQSIERTISKDRYNWLVARVDSNGRIEYNVK